MFWAKTVTWDANKSMDACITDIDPLSKSGAAIECCLYNETENELCSALLYARSHPISEEALAELQHPVAAAAAVAPQQS